MSNGFRGSNQDHDHRGPRIGVIRQHRLLPMMRVLIDKAREEHSSRTRDAARTTLRDLHATAHWNTSFVLRNLGVRRCRWLAEQGWVFDRRFLLDAHPEGLAEMTARQR